MTRREESGAVTAETAVALPLIAIFTLSMAWLVSIGITEVRALDAAREAARAAARSDAAGEATSLGQRVAPDGSRITISRSGRRRRRAGQQPGQRPGRACSVGGRPSTCRPRPWPRRSRRGDGARRAGAGSVLAVAMLGLLVTVTVAAAGVVGIVATHRTAQSAADLAALAGAAALQDGGDACEQGRPASPSATGPT